MFAQPIIYIDMKLQKTKGSSQNEDKVLTDFNRLNKNKLYRSGYNNIETILYK